jgi:hypothetical protein
MLARSLVLTALTASVVSGAVASAVTRLSLPPSVQAGPAVQTETQTVRASHFEIVDATGKVRGSLGILGNSSVALDMLDHGGATRVRLSLLSVGSTEPDGAVAPGLSLFGTAGADARMIVGPDNTMVIGLASAGPDGNIKGVANINMDTQFPPTIKLLGEQGRLLWQAP